jgi:hypothetical protein
MKIRCTTDKWGKYHKHRGIKFCERWELFENFAADMGPHPGKGYSLDRINGDADYSPDNCRWATNKQQSQNRKFLGWTETARKAHSERMLLAYAKKRKKQ